MLLGVALSIRVMELGRPEITGGWRQKMKQKNKFKNIDIYNFGRTRPSKV